MFLSVNIVVLAKSTLSSVSKTVAMFKSSLPENRGGNWLGPDVLNRRTFDMQHTIYSHIQLLQGQTRCQVA
jgi:hypothetical protein